MYCSIFFLKGNIALVIKHIYEPDDLQCGQAVLAMLTGIDIVKIAEECGTTRETKLADMKRVLSAHGFEMSAERKAVQKIHELPQIALLSLETPRCWHWSLYFDGVVYDPEHGVLNDFPNSNRKYFWEIKKMNCL